MQILGGGEGGLGVECEAKRKNEIVSPSARKDDGDGCCPVGGLCCHCEERSDAAISGFLEKKPSK